MRALIVKAAALLGLCGVFVVLWNCTESFDPERSAICDLQPSDEIDFGLVELGTYRETTLTFRNLNPGDYGRKNSFEIDEIDESADCEVFEVPSLETRLFAGEELSVLIRFMPQVERRYECVRSMMYWRQNSGEVAWEMARPCSKGLKWSGSGVVSPMFSVEPSEIAGGTVLVGELGSKGIRITNLMDREIGGAEPALPVEGFKRRSDATCPAAFRVEPGTAVIPMGESREFTVHFEPTEPGDWLCEFDLLLGDAADSYRHFFTPPPGPHLTVTATSVAPACALEPGAELDYGQVEVGSSSMLTLTIRNETPDPIAGNQFKFDFNTPSGTCGVFSMHPADSAGIIGPGESKDIPVTFAPDAGGAFECTRSLASLKEPADPADPSIVNACPASVTWRGEGIAGTSPVWSSCAPGGTNDWHGVSGVSGSEIYVAGDGGRVIASVGDCNWPASGTVFSDVNLRDIWAYSDGASTVAWAVGNIPPPPGTFGETGAVLRMDGALWYKVDEGIFVTYGAVWGSAFDDVYFVGTGIATDFPDAKHWNGSAFDTLHISPMGMSEVSGVSGNAANDIWAVLRQQAFSVYHYDGSEWTNETQPWMNKPLHDVWTVAGTGFYQVYAVGEDGAIYHFDGTHWTDESIAGETRDFNGVWVSQTGQVFVVGEGSVIYRSDGNNNWTQQTPSNVQGDLMDVWGASDSDVYAVGTNGLILRYAPPGP